MQDVSLRINPAITPQSLANLREAVGWNRSEEDYPRALQGYWASIGGFTQDEMLVAWCAILSDGVRHAVLLDVIVHPTYQRQGIGRALVAKAIEHIRAQGITLIHVDFLPEKAAFYQHCGFMPGLGGIIDIEG